MTVNVIGDEGAKSMSKTLKTNTTLASLNLGGEEEGKNGESNDELMTDNKIGAEGAKSLSKMLKTNTTLTSLSLYGEEEGK